MRDSRRLTSCLIEEIYKEKRGMELTSEQYQTLQILDETEKMIKELRFDIKLNGMFAIDNNGNRKINPSVKELRDMETHYLKMMKYFNVDVENLYLEHIENEILEGCCGKQETEEDKKLREEILAQIGGF